MNTMQDLVLQYVPLANKLAYQKKKNLPKFVDIEDLKSAAYLGLVEAASRFDHKKGVAFSTFAYPRIFGAIHDYLREQAWFKNINKPVLSLDSLVLDEKDYCLKDIIPSKAEHNVDECLEFFAINLDDQAKNVFNYYYIEDYSMKEVGEKIGLSESRISQLIKNYKQTIKKRWNKFTLIEELAA